MPGDPHEVIAAGIPLPVTFDPFGTGAWRLDSGSFRERRWRGLFDARGLRSFRGDRNASCSGPSVSGLTFCPENEDTASLVVPPPARLPRPAAEATVGHATGRSALTQRGCRCTTEQEEQQAEPQITDAVHGKHSA